MNQNNTSLEKATKGLECCLALKGDYCDNCPYSLNEYECDKDLLKKDVLALLKEQQPIKPLIAYDMYFCGNCKYAIPRTANYCPKCGKKVEWDV